MPAVTLNRTVNFPCEAGASLLDAAAAAHVTIAHSCRTGRCSTCRCKIKSGESRALHPELGLTEAEKREGWILSCVRTAETDLTLDADDVIQGEMPRARTLPCRIHSLERLSPDVVKAELRLPSGSDFAFRAGQYVDLIGHGGIRRSYSLAGRPQADRPLELHIRHLPGGAMSDYWFGRARTGDLLRLNGPFGTFFIREVAGLDLVFLSTGTGIAPAKAMLEDLPCLTPLQVPRSVSVYWGGRGLADLYLPPFDAVAGCRYTPVLSRPHEGWPGAKGYVQDVFLEERTDLSRTIVYACGSDAMIRSAKSRLVDAGVAEHRFLSDAFVASGDSWRAQAG